MSELAPATGSSAGLQQPAHPAESFDREALHRWQEQRLRALLTALNGRNPFYTRKLRDAGLDPATLRLPDDLVRVPVTTKAELIADQETHAPWGSALTEPVVNYTRYCQTS